MGWGCLDAWSSVEGPSIHVYWSIPLSKTDTGSCSDVINSLKTVDPVLNAQEYLHLRTLPLDGGVS